MTRATGVLVLPTPRTNSSERRQGRVWGALHRPVMAFRLQGELPGPHESITTHLIRKDAVLGTLDVRERLHASMPVVSNVLAAGPVPPPRLSAAGAASQARDYSS
jgi:hypothetical protein